MAIRATAEQFIEKAIHKHGKNYDYSKVNYNNSFTKVKIVCQIHGEFLQSPSDHLSGKGCRKCGLKKTFLAQQILAMPNQGESLLDKFPVLCKEWSLKNTLGPENYKASSNKKVWWICLKCNHEWHRTINNRVRGDGCVKCGNIKTGKFRSTPKLNQSLLDLKPKLCEEWSNKNKFGPQNYKIGSNKKVWWICKDCKYEYCKDINSRAGYKNTGCPVCCGRLVSDKNRLSILRPDLAKQWDYSKNTSISPSDVCVSTAKKYWWICPKCKLSYNASCANRNKDKGCPKCKTSHGEKKLEKFLIENNVKYESQYRIEECKNKRPLPFDFAIWIDEKLQLIEYHGTQHYELSTTGWNTCEKRFQALKNRDKIKENYCKDNNIPLLIIPYWDKENIESILDKWINGVCHDINPN